MRAVLFALFRRPEFSKKGLADYCGQEQPWLSNFLHPNPKRNKDLNPSFHLDELDDIAGYFHISLGELLGVPKPAELTGDESRLLLAFRALAVPMQSAVLALIEQAALASRIGTTLRRAATAATADKAQDAQRTGHADEPQAREVEARRLTVEYYDNLAAVYAPARTGRQTSAHRRTSTPIPPGLQPPRRPDPE